MKLATTSCRHCGVQIIDRVCIKRIFCSFICREAARRLKPKAIAPCSVFGCGTAAHARGLCNLHYKRWQIHGDPLTRTIREAGEGTPHIDGYWMLTINGESKLRHVHIAELALGRPLPNGAQVHHVDQDRSNDRNDNLVICPSFAYHKLLHTRQAALDACGNMNWRKCWICKQHDDPALMIPVGKTSHAHSQCQKDYANAGYHRRQSQRKAHELSISTGATI